MMILKKINLSDHGSEIEYITQLYEYSFPKIERRPIKKMLDLLGNDEIFNVVILVNDDQYVGFITYWMFDDFSYVEHFAIDANIRGKGFGKETLKHLSELIEKPIILEVEEPKDEMSIKRISFYKSFGFKFWGEIDYLQPPYAKELPYLPLKLMTYREIDLGDERVLSKVKSEMYLKVYQYTESM